MADSDAAAVESAAETTPNSACPVLSLWHQSPIVMSRVTQTSLVQIPPKTVKIKREHLADNVDLLGPLINHLGALVKLELVCNIAWCLHISNICT